VPTALQPCAACHAAVVDRYLEHGMSRSIGPAEGVTAGTVTNPSSRIRYEVSAPPAGPLLTATFPDGGTRRQRIVGRIGAGIFDTSWVGAELDGDAVTGRLFFAPVETLTGRGLALSPFELHPGSAGLDETERWVITNGDAEHPHPRLTLTFPGIARNRTVVFTVAGEGKREAFAQVRAGDDVPAARVEAEHIIWLVDPAAAG